MTFKKFLFSAQICILCLTFFLPAVNSQSQVFKLSAQNHINDFAMEGNYLWIATDGGVVKFNTSDQSHTLYTTVDGLVSNYVTTIAVDKTGAKWFGTYDGVTKFDGSIWKTFTKNDGMVSNLISKIIQDKSGLMWFGTVGNGAIYYDGSAWKIRTSGSILTSNYVNTFGLEENGTLWFGTQSGISSWLSEGSKYAKFATIPTNSSKIVYAMAVDRNNVKWIGTNGGGISFFDDKTWKTHTTAEGAPSNYINTIAVDNENVKWVGYPGTGVASFDGKKWAVYSTVDGDTLKDVRAIAIDSNNVKWIGTSDGKIWKFDTSRPAAPSSLTAEVNNIHGIKVTLNWDISPDNAFITGYNIYRSKSPNITIPVGFDSFESIEKMKSAEDSTTIYLGTVASGQTEFVDSYGLTDDTEYFYWISADILTGLESAYTAYSVTTPLPVGVEKNVQYEFAIGGIYPNPFNPRTTIEYSIPETINLSLTVYNISGQVVSVLKNGIQNAGKYSVVWNAEGMPSGMYLAALKGANHTVTKKLMLLK